ALDGRFGEKQLGRLYLAILRTRIQRRNESLSELAIDIERLTRLAYQGCTTATLDSAAVGNFLDAIGDTEVQTFVRLSSPASMRDAVARAMEVEATTRGVRATRRPSLPAKSRLRKKRESRSQRCKFKSYDLTKTGFLYVDGEIPGVPCKMLVDT
ncbi:unnamed protein product, partial [Ixodes persulcatus]